MSDIYNPSNAAPSASSLTSTQTAQAVLLPNWQAALGNVAAGISNATILVAGDSISYSLDSYNGQVGNQRTYSWPNQFATLLAQQTGLNVSTDSFMGYNQYYFSPNFYDPRLTVSGSVGGAGDMSLGGDAFNIQTGGEIDFVPTKAWNQAEVYIWGYGGGPTISMQIGANAAHTFSTNLGNLMSKVVITDGAAAMQTLKITLSSGNFGIVCGAVCYDNSKKWVNVINAGMPGWTAVQEATTSPPNYFYPGDFTATVSLNAKIAPNLTFIEFGINDFQSGETTATFNTALTSLVTGYQGLNSDVVLIAPHQIGTGNANSSTANQTAFQQTILALATSKNCLCANLFTQMGTYAQIQARVQASLLDTIHLNGSGYYNYASANKGLITL